MQQQSGQSVELWNTATQQALLRIEKKGDYNIKTTSLYHDTASSTVYLSFTDCKETQIFSFRTEDLVLTKLGQVICQKNEIDHLPAASRLFFTKEDSVKLLILTTEPFGLLELNLGDADY